MQRTHPLVCHEATTLASFHAPVPPTDLLFEPQSSHLACSIFTPSPVTDSDACGITCDRPVD